MGHRTANAVTAAAVFEKHLEPVVGIQLTHKISLGIDDRIAVRITHDAATWINALLRKIGSAVDRPLVLEDVDRNLRGRNWRRICHYRDAVHPLLDRGATHLMIASRQDTDKVSFRIGRGDVDGTACWRFTCRNHRHITRVEIQAQCIVVQLPRY